MTSILIVEENVSLGRVYAKLFSEIGLTVTRLTSVEQTISYLATSTIPNIILLDMAGNAELIARQLHVSPQFIQTHVVMLVGEHDYSLPKPRPGKEHVFYKPVPFGALVRHVMQLVEN